MAAAATAAAAAPPHPAILIEDLIELFLLRLPPEDPAVLARAALVSRQWHRVVTGAVFRRRYREFHRRSPPLLGYISNIHSSIRFVPVSSFRPRHAHADRRDLRAVHSSHGRVLLHRSSSSAAAGRDDLLGVLLSVWDPITDEHWHLPEAPLPVAPGPWRSNWDAAVVCAALCDGCSHHMHCHFKVVCVGRSEGRDFSCFYSSEAGIWSDPILASPGRTGGYFVAGTSVHAGSALYSLNGCNHEIFKYDLLTDQMSTICLRVEPGIEMGGMGTVLIATEDGRLGVATTSNSTLNSTLHLWLREHGRWEERRRVDLRTLLPDDALRDPLLPREAFADKPWVAGFAETGAGVIFFTTRVGYFAVDLKSGRSKNIGKCLGWGCIIPYVSFCTPAPGAITVDEGSGADALVFTDEAPGSGFLNE